jgi:hypothetical protein
MPLHNQITNQLPYLKNIHTIPRSVVSTGLVYEKLAAPTKVVSGFVPKTNTELEAELATYNDGVKISHLDRLREREAVSFNQLQREHERAQQLQSNIPPIHKGITMKSEVEVVHQEPEGLHPPNELDLLTDIRDLLLQQQQPQPEPLFDDEDVEENINELQRVLSQREEEEDLKEDPLPSFDGFSDQQLKNIINSYNLQTGNRLHYRNKNRNQLIQTILENNILEDIRLEELSQ